MSTASDWQRDHEVGKKIKSESSAEAGRMMEAARRSSSLPAAGAGPGSTPSFNTMTPCAACKLLRRRCAQECPFSPFFSPLEPHKFASVHKVFGASNVSKMLLEVHESQRGDAANSLVYEANLRLRDPVYGCMGAILTLQQQVHALEADLAAVRAQILKHTHSHRYRPAAASAAVPNVPPSSHASQLLAAGGHRPAAPAMGPAASASSSTTAVYAAASSSTDYSSITHENVPYFG